MATMPENRLDYLAWARIDLDDECNMKAWQCDDSRPVPGLVQAEVKTPGPQRGEVLIRDPTGWLLAWSLGGYMVARRNRTMIQYHCCYNSYQSEREGGDR